jgi:dienelactone hydrolase
MRGFVFCAVFPVWVWGLELSGPASEPGTASRVVFRRQAVNRESEFGACAAIDVNRDGRLDIVSGGFWYEAPDWTKRPTREVEQIRGRFDDYSNLPLDVDGDGLTDLISVNYRSRSLYWVGQPRDPLGVWQKHVIDTPGASETGLLVDVNSDGRPDVLPNGMDFAAWYELLPGAVSGDSSPPRWQRHELPAELIAHGIGCGDINGDGRNDLVGPRGWAEASLESGQLRWTWHAEFALHRDASVPILVHDVDGDGDSDLIWGRGHNVGLYWYEQSADADGQRVWTLHAIDTSWSQVHAIMLADLDGDGREDLVAGKRFLGHDGKDPGEYDPLAISWYRFDAATKTWTRHLVSAGDGCGMDLDPKCVDIDGDGDIDILAPARSGLFLLENLRIGALSDKATEQEPEAAPGTPLRDPDPSQLLVYRDSQGQLQPVQSPLDWGLRRQHILENMQQVMGPLPGPERRIPLSIQVLEQLETDDYIRQKITYAAEPGDRVPAFLLLPKRRTKPTAAMLCLHPTSPLGKSQLVGVDGIPTRFYAHELAQRGYVCLVPDYPSFGEYEYDFQTAGKDYVSGTMKGIWNHVRGLDVLESLPQVDRDRIGCIGHSLGGHNALFVAAFDQRIRAVVTSCGFNAFEDYYGGNLKGWTSDRYMPKIRDDYDCDPQRMPFDFHEILGAMAPRPVFVNSPLHDANFAVAGVRKAVASARDVYRLRDADAALQVSEPDTGHDFPDEIRAEVYQWLDEKLGRSSARVFP